MSDSGPSLIAGEVRSGGPIGPGPKLRAARTSMSVEVREVADALNLPTTMIDAIETNDFAAMPSLVFARGYVRAYAKLVELDPDEVVQAFSQASSPAVEPKAASTITANINVGDDAPLAQRLGALRTALENQVRENPLAALGILAAAMVLLMLLLWVLFGGSDADNVQATGTVAPTSAGVPVGGAPAPGSQVADVAAATGSPASGPPAQRGGFTDADIAVSERSVAAPAGVPADPSQQPLAPDDQVRLNDGDDRLRFTFVADCWVEVRATDDSVLYGDLGQSGKQLELIGQGPFKILLGYAPGARLAFNGENVVLGPHTRNDLARLVLGQ